MKIASLVFILRPQPGTGNTQVLLGEKKRGAEIGSGLLNAPGGKLEEADGGNLAACAARETQEEFGIYLNQKALEAEGPAAIITFFAGGVPDFEVHVFSTGEFEGEPQETESMHAPLWYETDNLPWERMHSSDKAWWDKIFRGERFSANVYYSGRGTGFERIDFLSL